jgi:hypothetical protein
MRLHAPYQRTCSMSSRTATRAKQQGGASPSQILPSFLLMHSRSTASTTAA